MNADELPHLVAELLLKSALVILVGFTFVALIRRSAPAGKHSMWQCIFAAGLAIPLLLMFPRWEILPSWTELRTPKPSTADTERSISILPATDYRPVLPSGNQPASTAPPEEPFSLSSFLLGLWVVGVMALLLQSVAGHEFLRRLERKARPPGTRLRSQFERLRSVVGSERSVTMLLSPAVRSPFAWGLAKPCILLPESAEQWPESDLEMVLIHELEHVRRGDARAVLIGRLFLALNWINPLAWIAHRHSVRYREEACDEEVVRYGHDPRDYADLLLRQARTASASAFFSCATSVVESGTVEGRVRRVLASRGAGTSNAPARSSLERWVALFAVAAVFLITSLGWRAVGAESEDLKNAEKSPVPSEQDEEAATTEEKLRRIVIPSIQFEETMLSEALAFLEQQSAEFDRNGKGIRIRLIEKENPNLRLSLRLKNVPLAEALSYTASLALCKFRVIGEGLEILKVTELPQTSPDYLYTNVYSVPPIAFAAFPEGDHRAKKALEKIGISFGKGSSVIYNPESMKLIVRNTWNQLKKLEAHFPQGWDEKEGVPAQWFLPPEEVAKVMAAKEVIEKKMAQIIVPGIEFADTPLSEALAFLEQRSVALDPLGEGVRFWITERNGSKLAEERITMRSLNATLSEALRDVTKLSRSTRCVTLDGVEILPSTELDPPPPSSRGLYTNIYSVPPDILSSNADKPKSAREKLESMGITFGPGADAIFHRDTSRLTIRNTIDQMELVEAYLESVLPKTPMNREGKAILSLMDSPPLPETPGSRPTIESIIQNLPETISPLTAEELDAKVPNSYYFDYTYQPQPGKRIWRRIDNET